MPILPVVFAGGDEGTWHVRSVAAVVGAHLAAVGHLAVLDGARVAPPGATWALLGVVGHERYAGGASTKSSLHARRAWGGPGRRGRR